MFRQTWYSAYLPINSATVADRFGKPFNIFNVVSPDLHLNTTAYAEYSPPYLPLTFAMTYLLSFALATALVVHTALHHGPRIWRAIRNVASEPDDIHMKLMRHYPEVPDWWFLATFAVTFLFAALGVELWHTGLPIWGFLVAVLLAFFYVVPALFVYAMTNQFVALNLIAELIPGYLFPGKAIPGMVRLRSLVYVTDSADQNSWPKSPRSKRFIKL